jgi:hypothetical protein
MLKFNAARLVEDCGGVTAVALTLGKTRTAPYRMLKTGYMGTPALAKLLAKYPDLNLNNYFEEVTTNGHTHQQR